MDELELLKSRWRSQEQKLPRLTYDEIYKMLLKKSSSIVKWIFFISIGEMLLWTGLAFLVPESSQRFTNEVGLSDIMIIANVLFYLVFICFILLFYRNYRKISTTDTVKGLMENIIRTRRTVNYFIIYNLVSTGVMLLGVNIFYYNNQDLVFRLMVEDYGVLPTMDQNQFFTTFFLVQLILGAVVITLIFFFYKLVYGRLLKRLNKNYQELKKIEV